MPSTDRVKLAQRHERLRELMCGKVFKYVGRAVTDGEKDFVAQEVDMLMHRGENSEASLKEIAKHIRSMTPAPSQAPTEDRLRRHDAASSVASANHHHHRQQAGSHVPSSVHAAAKAADQKVKEANANAAARKAPSSVGNLPPGVTPEMYAAAHGDSLAGSSNAGRRTLPKPAELHKDDLWAKLAQKEVEEFHKDALEHRRKHKKMEEEQRMYLEQQVALRQRKAVEVKKNEEQYIVEEVKQRESWEVENKRKEEERKRRNAEEKKMRDQQLDEARRRRAMEEARRRAEDIEAAKKIQAEYDKEQIAIKERRVKAKEDVVKAQEFNKHIEELRSSERAREKARDLEHQKQYLARLAKQDQEREDALAKMQEKQRHQQQIAFAMQAGISEKAKEDERKAEEHKKRLEAIQIAREKATAEKAAAAKVKQRQYLMLQMLERDEQKKQEREDLERQRERVMAEKEAAERKDMEKKILAKKKAEEHRRAVEDQIEQSQARHRPVHMTDAERKLNGTLLRKVGLTPQP